MSDMKAVAVARTRDNIRLAAQTVRDVMGYADLAAIKAEHLLEFAIPAVMPNFVYDICDPKMMPDAYGYAAPDRNYIALREDVYFKARHGSGRDLWTIGHEVGHLMLHESESLLFRNAAAKPSQFCDPEWQADTFAAEFLMDLRRIKPHDDEHALVKRFGVSVTAARKHLKFLHRSGLIQELYGPTRRNPAGP